MKLLMSRPRAKSEHHVKLGNNLLLNKKCLAPNGSMWDNQAYIAFNILTIIINEKFS